MPIWPRFNSTKAPMSSHSPKIPTHHPKPPKTNLPRPSSEPSLSSRPKPRPPSVSSESSSSRSRRRKSRIQTKNSDLTEESLNEFNRRNEAENKKNFISPYYHGLTDSGLYLEGLKCSSPGRESHVTTTTTTSFSTVFVKLQEWGSSCFKGKDKPSKTVYENRGVRPRSLDFEFSIKSLDMVNNGVSNQMKQDEQEQEEKLLRERVSVPSKVTEGEVSVKNRTKKIINQEEQEQNQGLENNTDGSSTGKKEKEKERFLWALHYRPKVLKEFICNKAKAEYLHELATRKHCSHFIFEGPPGVGKRTMVLALLREVYGPDKLETRVERREFELKSEAINSIKVKMRVSAHHVEINLSELRGYEKHVIVKLLKETHTPEENEDMQCGRYNCRAIILYEADKLSTDSQHYMRWVMDRHKSDNKIFFCCSELGKLQPIRSLCTIIQLEPPSNNEIVQVLEYIAQQERIELPSRHLAETIAEKSKQNLRQAIRSFEASWKLNQQFKEDQVIVTGWEEDIANIAKNIIEEQSPRQLYIIRGKLQKLIADNVSPEFIFLTLVGELKKHLEEQFKTKIDSLYLEYTRDVCCKLDGEKALVLSHSQKEQGKRLNDPARNNANLFVRIEEFIARFMSLYKSFVRNHQREPNGFGSK